jgi:AbrB family looped-hinge helix DNA binding protein
MKVGERGQVTIPKEIRDQFGITPETEVEFDIVEGRIELRKIARPLPIDKWVGHSGERFRRLGYQSVDDYIEDVRGR